MGRVAGALVCSLWMEGGEWPVSSPGCLGRCRSLYVTSYNQGSSPPSTPPPARPSQTGAEDRELEAVFSENRNLRHRFIR